METSKSRFSMRWSLALVPLLVTGAATSSADDRDRDRPPAPAVDAVRPRECCPALQAAVLAAIPLVDSAPSWWTRAAAAGQQGEASVTPSACPMCPLEQAECQPPKQDLDLPVLQEPVVAEAPAADSPGTPLNAPLSVRAELRADRTGQMRMFFSDQPLPAAPAPPMLTPPGSKLERVLADTLERAQDAESGEPNADATPAQLSRTPVGSALMLQQPPRQRLRLAVNATDALAAADRQTAESLDPWAAVRTENMPTGPAIVKLQDGESIALAFPDTCLQARVKSAITCELTHHEPHRLVITALKPGTTHLTLWLNKDGRTRVQTLILQVQGGRDVSAAAAMPEASSQSVQASLIPQALAPLNRLRAASPVRPTSFSQGQQH